MYQKAKTTKNTRPNNKFTPFNESHDICPLKIRKANNKGHYAHFGLKCFGPKQCDS